MIKFILGLFVGVFMGVFCMALVVVAREADEAEEKNIERVKERTRGTQEEVMDELRVE